MWWNKKETIEPIENKKTIELIYKVSISEEDFYIKWLQEKEARQFYESIVKDFRKELVSFLKEHKIELPDQRL